MCGVQGRPNAGRWCLGFSYLCCWPGDHGRQAVCPLYRLIRRHKPRWAPLATNDPRSPLRRFQDLRREAAVADATDVSVRAARAEECAGRQHGSMGVDARTATPPRWLPLFGRGAWLGAMRPPPGPPRMLLALAVVMHEEAMGLGAIDSPRSRYSPSRRVGTRDRPAMESRGPPGRPAAPAGWPQHHARTAVQTQDEGALVDRYLVGRVPGRGMQYREPTRAHAGATAADREVHRARRRLYPVNSVGGSTMIDSGREHGEPVARDVVSSCLGHLAVATQGSPIGWPACHPRRVQRDRGRGRLPRPVLLMQRQQAGSPPPPPPPATRWPAARGSVPMGTPALPADDLGCGSASRHRQGRRPGRGPAKDRLEQP